MGKELVEQLSNEINALDPASKKEEIAVTEEIIGDGKQTYSYTHALEASKDYFNGEELPAKVFVDKYAMKDLNGKLYEKTPDEMHWRLAREFGRIERNFMSNKLNGNDYSKLSSYGKNREILSPQRIYDMFKEFKYIIPQGSVMAILGNQFVIGSLSNCIVLPELYDSYGGILYADQELVQLMKRRCGVGLDLSTLRPAGNSVTNAAGSSTGPVSFMERFSNTTREVAQSGRRGALMLTIDVEHPDVESFITIKQDLSKVTGANISVRLSDEFMKAVKDDTEYTHRFPLDEHLKPGETQVKKTIKARDLWNIIIKAAHTSAEPGLIFWDRQHKYSTSSVYPGFKNTSTNPCLTKDTWVMTNEGPKEIEELIGVPFVSIVNGKESVSTDEGFFCTGLKKVYKLKTRNGFEIKATENHPLKKAITVNRKEVNSEMTELKDIKPGDFICLANDRPISWDGKGNDEIGWLLGSLLGDGTITEDRAYLCYWGDFKTEMKKTAISYLKNNLPYRKGFLGEGAETSYDIDVHDRTRFGSAELKKIAEEYGYVKDKKLKKEIEKTSSHFYRGFLSGWFDADGTVQVDMLKGVSVRLSSSILENLKIAQRMLARLGIISKVYENRKPEGWYDMPDGKGGLKSVFCNAGHELTITKDNIKEFYYKVGFLEEAKQNKIKSAIEQHSRGFYRERFVDVVTEITEIGEEEVFDCTVYPDHEFEANGFIVHNCSEIAMQGGDSCRLIAMNLYGCVINPFTPEAYFDFDKFYEITYESQRLMDDLVELELEAVGKIISKIESDPEPDNIKQVELATWKLLQEAGKKGRRTGLGFTALGDAIAALGLKFDSEQSLETIDKIMRTKLRAEFDSSIDMSIERGPFEGFNKDIELTSEFVMMMKDDFNDVYGRMLANGRRNISISTVAPTGSLSILAQTSSGLEPVFMLSYKRRKKINSTDLAANVKVDFVDSLGDKWQEFVVYHPKIKTWMEVTGETDEKKSPYAGSTAPEIDWVKRVEMQAIIQKYITHSISSTINLPSDVSIEKVGEIYLKSWEMGLKGITVYRDGSRSGVLVSNEAPKENATIYENNAPKRPKSLDCDVIRFTNKGEKWIGFVGLFEGRPYEVFTGKADAMKVPYYVESGKIRKLKTDDGTSKYDFVYLDKDKTEVVEEWLNKTFDKHYWNYAKMLSGILRHGMPLPYVVDLINSLNLDDDLITTWKNGISRMVKKYIPDGTVATDKQCKQCKSESVIYQEGCLVCNNCGSSKCG